MKIFNFKFLIFKSSTILLLVISYLFLVGLPVFAGTILGKNLDCIEKGDCQLIHFLILGRIIIQAFLGIIGVYALVFFITGGIMMIISGGKQEKILTAKRMLGFSVIGMIIAFFAWQIVNLVICGVTQGQLQETCQIFGRDWNVFPQ